MRQIILGGAAVVMAFSLRWPLSGIQAAAGIFLIVCGFHKIDKKK